MLAGIAFVLLAAAAPAAPRAVGVLPLRLEGTFTGAQQETMTSTVTDGLAQEAKIIAPSRVAKKSRDARACADAACWRAAAEGARARYLADVRVSKSGPDYALDVRLVDGKTGELLTSAERKCEICGFSEMTQMLGEMVSAVSRRMDEASVAGVLTVTTTPEGARVRLDRRLLGTTPLDLPVAPGQRTLRITKHGYIAREQPVMLVAGSASHVEVSLEPRPRSRLRALGWGALAGGVVAMGVGATLMALDGREARTRCSGADVDDDGDCRFRYGTLTGGVVSVVAGSVLLGTATALLVIGAHKEDQQGVRVAVSPSGLWVEGRF